MSRRGRILALALLVPACGGTVRVEQQPCPFELRGVCVGVPDSPMCDGDFCVEGAVCASVVEVHDDVELAAALAGAPPGRCIALARGDYSAASLPDGVSLLGRGAGWVRVKQVTVGGGSGALVRGLEIGSGGLSVSGRAELTLHAVRVKSSAGDGVRLEEGARLGMSRSEVVSSTGRGILAVDFGALALSRSVVSGAPSSAIWAQCGMGCDCPEQPLVALDRVLVQHAGAFGFAFIGVDARVLASDVLETVPGADFQVGGAVAVSGCSDVSLEDVHVQKSAGLGILIDESSASLGVEGAGLIVSGATQGVVVSGVGPDQHVDIVEASIEDNAGVGVCVGGFSSHVSIRDSAIARTRTITLPVSPGGAVEVGDGLEWTGGTEVRIDGLSMRASQRQSMLIDGPVVQGSRIDGLVLSLGDEATGIVQQKVLSPNDAPEVGPGVPSVKQVYEPVWEVACP